METGHSRKQIVTRYLTRPLKVVILLTGFANSQMLVTNPIVFWMSMYAPFLSLLNLSMMAFMYSLIYLLYST